MRNQATPAKLSRKDCAMLAKNNLKLELEKHEAKTRYSAALHGSDARPICHSRQLLY